MRKNEVFLRGLLIYTMENLTNTDTVFKTYFDQTLERCGWSEEVQKGLLFFLGTSIVTANTDQILSRYKDEIRIQEELHYLIRLYAKPNEAYDPFNEIEATPISSAILTYNHIVLHELLGQENQIEKFIKQNPDHTSIISDASVLEDWTFEFKDTKYKLATLHRLNIKFFEYIGQYLKALHLDNTQCYVAGINYYQKYQSIDFEGTNFLSLTIIDTLSPVFKTLFAYPLLFTYHPNELNSNHLFSSILQFFYMNANTDIAKYVHQYHHQLFYTQNPRKVRKEWNFEKEKRGVIISQIVHNAMNIRKTMIGNYRSHFLQSDNYIMKELKDKTMTREDFKGSISHLIETYYEMKIDDVIEKSTHAEFLQTCAILYYETAVHAMLLKEFKS